MKKLFLMALILVLFNNVAMADGECPDGYYFTGRMLTGQGASYPECAPSSQQSQQEPIVRWQARWGAIATDDTKGIVGAVKNAKNKRSANKAAIQQCKLNGGGKNCEVTLSYYNQCSAIAWGDTSRGAAGRSGADSAVKAALEVCGKRTTNCKIVYAGCSLPERVN